MYPPKIEKIKLLGEAWGWRVGTYNKQNKSLLFRPMDLKSPFKNLIVYSTTMTVSTAMKHPKMGDTQLYRRNVSMTALEKIFKNPRIHTGRGYYNKK